MSIKHNIKRRGLMMVALAMSVTVLAAGTARAQAMSPSEMSLSQTASSPKVVVGEPVAFHITLTNESPNDIDAVGALFDELPADVQFVSASTSQGEYRFEPTHLENGDVHFTPGIIPAGGTVQMEVVMVPQKKGTITNKVEGPTFSSEAKVSVYGD